MSMSNQHAGGSDQDLEVPDMSLYEDETSNVTGDGTVETELAAPDAELATPDAETSDSANMEGAASADMEDTASVDVEDTASADMEDAAPAPESEASDDINVPFSIVELKYPEIFADMMALQNARDEFDIVRQNLSDRAARNRDDLLNLLRIRSLNAHFADILGGNGIYNDQEIVDLTDDPLLDAEFERVMQDIRDMRSDVAMLTVRHATLAEWAKDIRKKRREVQAQELENANR